jgi:hypothetical protein
LTGLWDKSGDRFVAVFKGNGSQRIGHLPDLFDCFFGIRHLLGIQPVSIPLFNKLDETSGFVFFVIGHVHEKSPNRAQIGPSFTGMVVVNLRVDIYHDPFEE